MANPNLKKYDGKATVHIDRYRAIEPYINFKYDLRKKLTRSQEKRIKRYYDEFRESYKFQPTTKLNIPKKYSTPGEIHKIQLAIGYETNLRGFKALPVPSRQNSGERAYISNGRVVLKSTYLKTVFIPFEGFSLLPNSAEKNIKKLIKPFNKNSRFYIANGDDRLIKQGFLKEDVARATRELLEQYKTELDDNGNIRKSGADIWLVGLRAYIPTNQKVSEDAINDYMVKYSRELDSGHELARKHKRRERRALLRRKKHAKNSKDSNS